MQEQSEDASLQAQFREDVILQQQMSEREASRQVERAIVLRVYNYYRVVVSFFLIILFYQNVEQRFVGTLEPTWFQALAISYLIVNIVLALYCLAMRSSLFQRSAVTVAIVITDIVALSMIMWTSGGVQSGLGNLLIFPVAFGGVMISGRLSYVLPASAAIACFVCESYVSIIGAQQDNEYFFQVALLGSAFFAVSAFFQYLSGQVKEREQEVVSLETLNRMREIAEQSRLEMEDTTAKFDILLASTGEGVLGLNVEGSITFANPMACQLLELSYEELMQRDIRSFMLVEASDPNQPVIVIDLRRQKILDLLEIDVDHQFDPDQWQTSRGEAFLVEYTCEAIFNRKEEKTGAVVLFQNITKQSPNEERLQQLTHLDTLTDLANRSYFNDALRVAISRSERSGRMLGVLILDVDHFKRINESMGHEAGDHLLQTIANRLKNTVRASDLVARFGGDQFAIMLIDLDLPENAVIAADRFMQEISEPIEIYDKTADISVSIGIAISDDNTKDADEITTAAASAVKMAKAKGRNTYCFFKPEIQQKAKEKRRITTMLRTAADNNEFNLMYQPIVSLKEQRINSCEALIRWAPKDSEAVRPDIFIPIAEETGQIIGIGTWVLQTVFAQVKRWKDELGTCPPIAINISSKQLKNHEFREQFKNLLEKYDIPAELVELELTETAVMDDQETCLAELLLFRKLGVKISIDDFGTGYSTLDYLRRLPLDFLKIHQSFTWGIGESRGEEIIEVMIRMAHAMDLKVICEGVETRQQLAFLQHHNCDLIQGYLFSKPRSINDITELFVRRVRRHHQDHEYSRR